MQERVTIRQIAEEAGVHFTTVSLALRNSPRLPVKTRTRINKIARKMGYRPDPMLVALSSYRATLRPPAYQATIAWINNWPKRKALTANPEFHDYYEGTLRRANQLGYVVEEFWVHEPGMTPEKLRRVLRARNIQALLLPPQPQPPLRFHFDYRDFSAVAFGYSLQPSVLHVVTNHQLHSMRQVLSRMREFGYRRIGLMLSPGWDQAVENAWMGGLLLERWKHPGLAGISPLVTHPRNPDFDVRFKQWIDRNSPDAIVSSGEVVTRIRALGYRIPKDIGFAGLNLQSASGPISGVHQNSIRIGETAVDFVVGMLLRGERGLPESPIRTLVESIWVPGKTLRKQKGVREMGADDGASPLVLQ